MNTDAVAEGTAAVGPGLAITEVVRFVATAYRVCRIGFEIVGQRSAVAEPTDARIALAEVSRRLGATLEIWDGLRPDSVGLRALEETIEIGLNESPIVASLRIELAQAPLVGAATALLAAVLTSIARVAQECAPVADANLAVELRLIATQLTAAADLSSSLVSTTPIPPSTKISVLTTSLLLGARNSFSSSLTVSN